MITHAATGSGAGQSWALPLREGRILWAALGVVLLMQIELVFAKSINWDELFHFSQIHQYVRGEQVQWLQTPHVRLFAWVTALPGDALTHIRLIRLMMLGFELVAVAAIIDIARRQSNGEIGKLVGLMWLTGGFVFLHGFALRADIIATALLMSALWIALVRPWRLFELTAIAVLATLATVATIKSVFYLPAFLGAALLRRDDWPGTQRQLATAAASMLVVVPIAMLSVTDLRTAAGQTLSIVPASFERMFSAGLFPQGAYLLKQILIAPFLSAAIGYAALWHWRRGRHHARQYSHLLFLAPLLTLAVYRNSYPYHFVFLLAPVMLALTPAVERLRARFGGKAMAAFLVVLAIALSLTQDRAVTARQEIFQRGIAQIFPEPVRYFDDVGAVPAFPRAVPRFASGWALEAYRRLGRPDYSMAAAAAPVPLLVRQGYALEQQTPSPADELALLPADARMLRENYIPHWGNVQVAGKRLPSGTADLRFSVVAPGIYTVEGGALTIDGLRREVGEVVYLDRSEHRAGPRTRGATLRWGNHLPVPDVQWPSGPLFADY